MAKRPSLADSLRASLSKGVHVETAERISRGLDPVSDEVSVSPVHVGDVTSTPPTVVPPSVDPVVVSEPVAADPVVISPSSETSDRGIYDRQIVHHDTYHGHIEDRGMVEYSTVKQLTISQPDIQPSNMQPSDRLLYDRQIVNGEIGDHKKHIPFEVKSLSYNQAAVFEFLISAGAITNMRKISEATHVGVPSVKDAVSRLVRRGFMTDPVTIRSATFQGFSYVLNERIVDLFLQSGGLEHTFVSTHKPRKTISDGDTSHGRISIHPTVAQSTVPPPDSQRSNGQPSDGRIVHSSSLESFEKLTTSGYPTVEPSTIPPSDSSTFVLSGPGAFFWEDEGLQEGQALKWCQDFEVEPAQMRQQLEWARFDIETNNKRAEVKNTINWFFGVLRKTGGCYPRPANYKSPAEIREDTMRLDQEREQKAKESIRLLEAEAEFQQVLTNPGGDIYQKLYAQTNEFERELGGETLVRVLRDKFFTQNGVVHLL